MLSTQIDTCALSTPSATERANWRAHHTAVSSAASGEGSSAPTQSGAEGDTTTGAAQTGPPTWMTAHVATVSHSEDPGACNEVDDPSVKKTSSDDGWANATR